MLNHLTLFLISYGPGHVIIFRSSCLYHEVTHWKPTIKGIGDCFTPGRAAYVYFSHKDMVEQLKDKPEGWYRATAGGKFDTGLGLPLDK